MSRTESSAPPGSLRRMQLMRKTSHDKMRNYTVGTAPYYYWYGQAVALEACIGIIIGNQPDVIKMMEADFERWLEHEKIQS